MITSNDFTTQTPTRVRVLAEYKLFSDLTAPEWFQFITDEVTKSESLLAAAELIYSTTGVFGLQYLFFVADLYVSNDTEKEVRKGVRKTLNQVVGDTDVKIHRITPINQLNN